VKVKVNEANVAIIQVTNGIDILKMNLCRLCGLPLDTPLQLADEGAEDAATDSCDTVAAPDAWLDRPELAAMGASVRIHEEKVRIARAEFLPGVVLTGGYFASYPSVFNSFEKKFKGTWNIGVAVNIPIVTWGDRRYKVRAARAEARGGQDGVRGDAREDRAAGEPEPPAPHRGTRAARRGPQQPGRGPTRICATPHSASRRVSYP